MTTCALSTLLRAALLSFAGPAAAQDCRLALILALDVSSSVDGQEDRLQREGLARALVSPEVREALLSGDPVALYVFEWSAQYVQVPFLPDWQLVGSEDDLAQIAEVIAASRRGPRPWVMLSTGMGEALVYASEALAHAPSCRARTVDVSADGRNNTGVEPAAVYGTYPFTNVTVNALVITGPHVNQELIQWVDQKLLLGPGAFQVLADGYEDYERAMRAKLLRELELPLVSGWALAGNGA